MGCLAQALGYEFDDDAYHALVHGTLPYHALKPDLVLRNLLLSMPQRKIVCQISYILRLPCVNPKHGHFYQIYCLISLTISLT